VKVLGHAAGGAVARAKPAQSKAGVVEAVVRESPLLIAFACSAAVLFSHLSTQFAADSWLNLLAGKEIVSHGLPHHDALAVLSHGDAWIDQQWLAHLFFYGAYAVGGLTLAAHANIAVFLVAVAFTFWFARRRGSGALSVVLCSIPMLIVGVEFIRAQVLVEPLFVALLALLASESRAATRRVYLAVPLLVLWANLHGTVVFAAALVATLGIVEFLSTLRLRRSGVKRLLRPLLLVMLPWACVFASPYGTSLGTYFRSTLRNPEFSRYLSEWAAPTFASLWGVILLGMALAAVALVARQRHALTGYELAALALALVGATTAVRSIPWFAIAFAMLVPKLLDRELPSTNGEPGMTRSQRTVVVAAVALALVTVAVAFAQPGRPIATDWPPSAAAAVAGVLGADPGSRVLAGYDLADWLLFEVPEARGRVAFDGRWEILPRSKFLSVMRYIRQGGPGWQRLDRGYRVVLLNPLRHGGLIRWYEGRGAAVLYRDSRAVVLDRGPSVRPKP
jgi:hypothetical protein